MRPNTNDYRQLFLSDTPLLDVRAPVEFSRGAFPEAQNLPLLNDPQRQKVGTEYKKAGQQAAIELGWQLASKAVRAQRLDVWSEFIRQHPHGYLYCFRGGLRSRTSQQILRNAGIDYPLVEGGYKAMRNYLLDQMAFNCLQVPLIVIAGHTGSGKTELIHRCRRALDLEGRALHRGSSFGRTGLPQPSQIDFENQLSIDLLKLAQRPGAVFTEDESRLIGRCALPLPLQQTMTSARRVMVEEPAENRARRIVSDYVNLALPRYADEQDPKLALGEELQLNLGKIQKRLGGLRYRQLKDQLEQANAELRNSGSAEAYVPLVMSLLTEYYDATYNYLMQQRRGNILFRGSYGEVAEWIGNFE